MKRLSMVVLIGLLALPAGAFSQTPQNKEPLLLQVVDDLSRARQQVEIERAACQVQVKELQQQLQAANAKTKQAEPTKEKK